MPRTRRNTSNSNSSSASSSRGWTVDEGDLETGDEGGVHTWETTVQASGDKRNGDKRKRPRTGSVGSNATPSSTSQVGVGGSKWDFPKQPDHFLWDARSAHIQYPEAARWLETLVMPHYELAPHDRRIPLALWDIWEAATPGCCIIQK